MTWYMLAFLKAWGQEADYLDAHIMICENGVPSWRLFEKPMNKHLYLKYGSARPPNAYKAMAAGGLKRIERRHSKDQKEQMRKSQVKFIERLLARGIPPQIVANGVLLYKAKAEANRSADCNVRKVIPRIPWHPLVRSSRIRRLLNQVGRA